MDFKATVVGIYGISGSGKSRALSQLADARPEWTCLEGSQVIQQVLENQGQSFQDFDKMPDAEKQEIRNLAVKNIQERRGLTVVAGHCSFPKEEHEDDDDDDKDTAVSFCKVFTQGDAATYSAILYLDKTAETISRQRTQDQENGKRSRPEFPVKVIEDWLQHDKATLKIECEKHNIYFALIPDDSLLEEHIAEHVLSPLIETVQKASRSNLLKEIQAQPMADVFLLIDGDRTLCPMDTGNLFFPGIINDAEIGQVNDDTLKKIFKRYPDYEFRAFVEVAMLYERVMRNDTEYTSRSTEIGQTVKLYPEWIHFLSHLPSNVRATVVTSGNREVWKAALEFNFVTTNHDAIGLIAGNHIGMHSYVVDRDAKETVAKELRHQHPGCKIISFGDSSIDIPMIHASDRGYIVIDDRCNRSMQDFITGMAKNSGVRRHGSNNHLYQLNLSSSSSHAPQRISSNTTTNPLYHPGIRVGSLVTLLQELVSQSIHTVIEYGDGSSYTSNLLSATIIANQSRRSDLSGPALQDIHQDMGRYLAERLLDEYGQRDLLARHNASFAHVQGTTFHGYSTGGMMMNRILILALMRGGEPMARGVYKIFPSSQFVHYYNHEDDDRGGMDSDKEDADTESTLQTMLAVATHVIIVDSVVNEGRSIRRVMRHLLNTSSIIASAPPPPHIYVLTGVMQIQASRTLPVEFPRVRFLALRLSENKYTGQGGTDTGNRLFGTTMTTRNNLTSS